MALSEREKRCLEALRRGASRLQGEQHEINYLRGELGWEPNDQDERADEAAAEDLAAICDLIAELESEDT